MIGTLIQIQHFKIYEILSFAPWIRSLSDAAVFLEAVTPATPSNTDILT